MARGAGRGEVHRERTRQRQRPRGRLVNIEIAFTVLDSIS